ncbi:hypothetical protein [Tuwongella immobilis]|uniref:Uncharacterized protein n=1 Tax=Tuwongella immobilis TaxID=692036 RepID=A0A6C2YJD6_9BACT|nr:hypothetical protein [Tuwongella immobilis]VIP01474.1 unnamed protein product [Tuwongella immobilis]VTR98514.1 unnamed protein product [Tuwongella immobilis]
MGRSMWIAALIGAVHGAVEIAVLFLMSDRYTLANDWLLVVMAVVANSTGFAVAARYAVNLLGVAISGLLGFIVGGWLGIHTIGNYEFTVPVPKEDRELRIILPGNERILELNGLPEEKVKRLPIGLAMGGLLGFAAAALLYARWTYRPDDDWADDDWTDDDRTDDGRTDSDNKKSPRDSIEK